MSPVLWAWCATMGVGGLAVLGVAGGRWCSRCRHPWWPVGYLTPLLILLSIALSRWFPWLELRRPFRWLMAGRREFALLALLITLLLTTLMSRLPRRREKVLLSVLMVGLVVSQSIVAFLLPAFNYRSLAELETMVDADGVCLQSTQYTCGPAAAVTALRRMGVEAHEGELAILAHTTNATGTPCDSLARAIEERYGVPARQVFFRDVNELRSCTPAIAVVKYAFLIDHFVTILEVADDTVIVGDPLIGRIVMTHQELTNRWRGRIITLTRDGPYFVVAKN